MKTGMVGNSMFLAVVSCAIFGWCIAAQHYGKEERIWGEALVPRD